MRFLAALRLALPLLPLLAPPLGAQPYGRQSDWSDRDRDRPARVVLYADPNFEGEGVEFFPGDDWPDLRQATFGDGRKVNDRVSSIRLEGAAKLRIYADPNFNGDQLEITGSVADLRKLARSPDGRVSWDDCITALRVDGPRRRPDWDRDDRRRTPRLILFSDPNFEGEGLAIEAGDDLPDLRRAPFGNGSRSNDKISSIRVEAGARGRVYADPNFTGDVLEITESIADLRSLKRGPFDWNDCITAVRVDRGGRGDGRPGPGRPAPRDPEPMIKKVFQDLLGQVPDHATLSRYRRLVIDENWSEEMVRADVMASAPYKNREADRIIRRVYRELLDREPDPTGYENFRRKIVDWGWSENDVRNAIRRSDEYRRRQFTPRPPAPPSGHRPRENSDAPAPAQP